jgi:hypothetical protein
MPAATRLELALDRIRFARRFTKGFLADLAPDEWFWSPPHVTTHIAWQVAHVAVAQYNLCLRRIRGRTAEDGPMISEDFIDTFKIGSQPIADAARNPPLDEIQRVFDGVFEKSLVELATRTDAELDAPLEQPHRVFTTKMGAVEFCPLHEMNHAGQIALLRRLMGKPPLR